MAPKARNLSINVPDEVHFELLTGFSNRQLSSEFFADVTIVAELRRGKRIVRICPEGEIRVAIGNESYRNGMASEELRQRNFSDADLEAMSYNGDFANSNWFNIYIGESDEDCGVSTESVLSDLDEAIVQAISLLNSPDKEWQEQLNAAN